MNIPLCPYVRHAQYHTLRANYFIKERVIFDYEILYVKDGSTIITIEDNVYNGNVGDVFFFRPRQRHSIRVAAAVPLIQPHVHFDLLYHPQRTNIPISFKNEYEITPQEQTFFQKDILDQFLPSFPQMIHLYNPTKFEIMLFDLIHEFEHPTLHQEIRLTSRFLNLWEFVLNEVTYNFSDTNRNKDVANSLKNYIEQNTSAKLTMDDLSSLTYFSKSYINRIFQENFHTSPIQYHSRLRIERAKSLLRNTNMTISQIAETLGFSAIQDFSRVFQKLNRYTPSSYRESISENLNEWDW